jgi:signal peptidase complex subunit 3
MKSFYDRTCYFGSVSFNATLALLFTIFAISYLSPSPKLTAGLRIDNYKNNMEYKVLYFYPNIDLSSQFNFNTKQIFLYLTYKTKTGNKQEMVWSKIIKNGDKYSLFNKEASNYIFTGDQHIKECIFELRGNIYPYVGQLKDISFGEVVYE